MQYIRYVLLPILNIASMQCGHHYHGKKFVLFNLQEKNTQEAQPSVWPSFEVLTTKLNFVNSEFNCSTWGWCIYVLVKGNKKTHVSLPQVTQEARPSAPIATHRQLPVDHRHGSSTSGGPPTSSLITSQN